MKNLFLSLILTLFSFGACTTSNKPLFEKGKTIPQKLSKKLSLPHNTKFIEQWQSPSQKDKITLLAQPFDTLSPYYKHFYLLVEANNKKKIFPFPEESDGGYEPQMKALRLSSKKNMEYLISAATGGSGGCYNTTIFSWNGKTLKPILDVYQDFKLKAEGAFLNNYKAELKIYLKPGTQKRFIFDLTKYKDRYKDYYHPNGQLIKEVKLWQGCLGELQPIDINQDGILGIRSTHPIKGIANFDTIGFLEITWSYNKGQWRILNLNSLKL